MGLLKIRNLKHKYGTIKTQFPRKTYGAQSSIKRRLISPRILVVKPSPSLKGLKKIPTILDPKKTPTILDQ
jgi:hypothetical protein